MVDLRAVTDYAEIAARWAGAYLGVPEQPDAFWEDWAAVLESELVEFAELAPNACAVMADATQPIRTDLK